MTPVRYFRRSTDIIPSSPMQDIIIPDPDILVEWYRENSWKVQAHDDAQRQLLEVVSKHLPGYELNDLDSLEAYIAVLGSYIDELNTKLNEFDIDIGQISGGEIAGRIESHRTRVFFLIDQYKKMLDNANETIFQLRDHIAHLDSELAGVLEINAGLRGVMTSGQQGAEVTAETQGRLAAAMALSSNLQRELQRSRRESQQLYQSVTHLTNQSLSTHENCMRDLANLSQRMEINTMLEEALRSYIYRTNVTMEMADRIVEEWKGNITQALSDRDLEIADLQQRVQYRNNEITRLSAQHEDLLRQSVNLEDRVRRERLTLMLQEVEAANMGQIATNSTFTRPMNLDLGDRVGRDQLSMMLQEVDAANMGQIAANNTFTTSMNLNLEDRVGREQLSMMLQEVDAANMAQIAANNTFTTPMNLNLEDRVGRDQLSMMLQDVDAANMAQIAANNTFTSEYVSPGKSVTFAVPVVNTTVTAPAVNRTFTAPQGNVAFIPSQANLTFSPGRRSSAINRTSSQALLDGSISPLLASSLNRTYSPVQTAVEASSPLASPLNRTAVVEVPLEATTYVQSPAVIMNTTTGRISPVISEGSPPAVLGGGYRDISSDDSYGSGMADGPFYVSGEELNYPSPLQNYNRAIAKSYPVSRPITRPEGRSVAKLTNTIDIGKRVDMSTSVSGSPRSLKQWTTVNSLAPGSGSDRIVDSPVALSTTAWISPRNHGYYIRRSSASPSPPAVINRGCDYSDDYSDSYSSGSGNGKYIDISKLEIPDEMENEVFYLPDEPLPENVRVLNARRNAKIAATKSYPPRRVYRRPSPGKSIRRLSERQCLTDWDAPTIDSMIQNTNMRGTYSYSPKGTYTYSPKGTYVASPKGTFSYSPKGTYVASPKGTFSYSPKGRSFTTGRVLSEGSPPAVLGGGYRDISSDDSYESRMTDGAYDMSGEELNYQPPLQNYNRAIAKSYPASRPITRPEALSVGSHKRTKPYSPNYSNFSYPSYTESPAGVFYTYSPTRPYSCAAEGTINAVPIQDSSLRKTVVLQSPTRNSPLYLDIEVEPQPIIQTESGEHVVCDISLDMKEPEIGRRNRFPSASAYATPPITTARRPSNLLSTPKSVFERGRYAIRNLAEQFDQEESFSSPEANDSTFVYDPDRTITQSPRSSRGSSPGLDRTY